MKRVASFMTAIAILASVFVLGGCTARQVQNVPQNPPTVSAPAPVTPAVAPRPTTPAVSAPAPVVTPVPVPAQTATVSASPSAPITPATPAVAPRLTTPPVAQTPRLVNPETATPQAPIAAPLPVEPATPISPEPWRPQTFTLREADGTVHTFPVVPERIVVLSRSIIFILHGLGITPVGIHTTTLPLPVGLEAVPRLGIPMNPNIEQLVALRPDLIILSSRFKPRLASIFAQHNLRAFFVENQSYEDTIAAIEAFGRAFDRVTEATRIILDMRAREHRLAATLQGKTPPRVMVLFGSGGSFFFATENSFVGDLVRELGAINVVEGARLPEQMTGYVPLSIEMAVALNPDIILRISHGNRIETLQQFEREFRDNPIWQNTTAVRRGRVYNLDSNLFDPNPGLAVIDALEELARILYK